MYEARKKSKGGDYGNQYTKMAKDHNDPKPKSTAEAIAHEIGVAEPTVKRAGEFAAGRQSLGFVRISFTSTI